MNRPHGSSRCTGGEETYTYRGTHTAGPLPLDEAIGSLQRFLRRFALEALAAELLHGLLELSEGDGAGTLGPVVWEDQDKSHLAAGWQQDEKPSGLPLAGEPACLLPCLPPCLPAAFT